MNKSIVAILFIVTSLGIACKSTNSISADINKQIFHEKSSEWTTIGDANWVLEKGIITGKGVLGYAVTTRPYKNFIMEAEFRPDAVVNSGIFVRCPEGEFTATGCYEINIADNHTNQDFRTGAIVTKEKPRAIINTVDKWNKFNISAIGNHVQVWLNGTIMGDIKDDTAASGFIGLQLNGDGVIQFRNVMITEI